MHIMSLVNQIHKAVEKLRLDHGDFNLAMIYNSALDLPTNWNLIVSSDWTDSMGVAESTRAIAEELYQSLGLENRTAVSRVTVLKTSDRFVTDMTQFYPLVSSRGGHPLTQLAAGGITGAGFVFYSQPKVAA
jgi:hypothetical protein